MYLNRKKMRLSTHFLTFSLGRFLPSTLSNCHLLDIVLVHHHSVVRAVVESVEYIGVPPFQVTLQFGKMLGSAIRRPMVVFPVPLEPKMKFRCFSQLITSGVSG